MYKKKPGFKTPKQYFFEDMKTMTLITLFLLSLIMLLMILPKALEYNTATCLIGYCLAFVLYLMRSYVDDNYINIPEKKYHFTRSFTTNEQSKLFNGLANAGFLPKETIYSHFYHVFEGMAIPDNERPFKPLKWTETTALLAYFIENAFGDTDGQILWKITEQCFTVKGKKPNTNSLKNAVSKYKQDTKNKPKGYEKIDDILSAL
jgi:Ca2+/Na+ antiporter